MSSRPDWYTDPTGRHEFRFYNGEQWTGDVSNAGSRGFDPIAPVSNGQRRRSRRALVATLLGFSGVTIVLIATLVVPRVADYLEPAPHSVEITRCDPDGTRVAVEVALTNTGTAPDGFTVHLRLSDRSGDVIRDSTLAFDAVGTGETARAGDSLPARFDEVQCSVRGVSGPLPFGINLGPAPSSG